MNTVKIEYKKIESGKRIIVTSDIHGHLNYLEKVLDEVGFSADDILIIIGDIIEKGPESLKTLRYVMELCEKGNVIPLIGNVDARCLHMIRRICSESIQGFFDYLLSLRAGYGTSFFDELTSELGYIVECPEDILKSKDKVITHFDQEFRFLSKLPTIVETQNFIFVHGGLRDERLSNNEKRGLFELTKYDSFMSTEHCFDKYVVVGHWPVSLYGQRIYQVNPIINREKKIISIDGGCGLKKEGQLNLLVIPEISGSIEDIYHISYDDLPIFYALSQQEESKDSINIRWIDNEIRILERNKEFAYAVHVATDRKLWLPNSYIRDDTHCIDYTDYVLPIQIGDKLSLVEKTSKGYVVKKEGVIGWYYGEVGRLKNKR